MITPGSPRSICIVRLSALGDVVMVLPLVRTLQARWPEAKITWIIGRGAHDAVAGLRNEGIEFVVIEKPRGIRDYLALRRRMKDRTFDVLLCLQASWRANLIYPCIRARRKIGYGNDRARDFHRYFIRECIPDAKAHLVDGFLQFAEALGLELPLDADWRLPVDASLKAWADGTLPAKPFFAVSPCASKPERDWPVERYVEVVRWAHAHGLGPIVLLGGPTGRDREVADALVSRAQVPILDLVGRTTIPQLIATLARCRLLLAPDTGAVHLANALGRPVVGLYAVAPAHRTGPYRRTEFSVDRFDEAVRTLCGADPARVPWGKRVHDLRAMSLIGVDEVISKVGLAWRAPESPEK
jgi:heptosyltransferase I